MLADELKESRKKAQEEARRTPEELAARQLAADEKKRKSAEARAAKKQLKDQQRHQEELLKIDNDAAADEVNNDLSDMESNHSAHPASDEHNSDEELLAIYHAHRTTTKKNRLPTEIKKHQKVTAKRLHKERVKQVKMVLALANKNTVSAERNVAVELQSHLARLQEANSKMVANCFIKSNVLFETEVRLGSLVCLKVIAFIIITHYKLVCSKL